MVYKPSYKVKLRRLDSFAKNGRNNYLEISKKQSTVQVNSTFPKNIFHKMREHSAKFRILRPFLLRVSVCFEERGTCNNGRYIFLFNSYSVG